MGLTIEKVWTEHNGLNTCFFYCRYIKVVQQVIYTQLLTCSLVVTNEHLSTKQLPPVFLISCSFYYPVQVKIRNLGDLRCKAGDSMCWWRYRCSPSLRLQQLTFINDKKTFQRHVDWFHYLRQLQGFYPESGWCYRGNCLFKMFTKNLIGTFQPCSRHGFFVKSLWLFILLLLLLLKVYNQLVHMIIS